MQSHFDSTIALSQFVGSSPTFIAVILAWIQSNARISDTGTRISDTNARFDNRFDDLKEVIRAEAMATCAEFRKVEEMLDHRLKAVEKRLG